MNHSSMDPSIPVGTKKRPREGNDEGDIHSKATSKMKSDNDGSNSNENQDQVVIRGLRLEAIFHPKFDNERNKKENKGSINRNGGSGDIRSTMLHKLGIGKDADKGRGHLEVSLKHSGSLVLWSGSTRYYSKNSACNEFTRTAEILLRQRFETVRQAMASVGITNENNEPHSYRSYEDCSRFVSHNRYTIAFEVVTAEMLGDHGQVPNLDYIVVTAVADRANERFLSTTQVLEFCHRFRLPHNDVWTFFPPTTADEPSSAETLFQMYDNSLRESGYTENTVEALTKIADVYIPSPIPHSVFQGSICEGFIVRYVNDAGDHTTEMRRQLERLAETAQSILKQVPAPTLSSPANKTPETLTRDPVLDTDMRALYQSIFYDVKSENEKSEQQQKPSSAPTALQRRRAELFSEKLRQVLHEEIDSRSDSNVDQKEKRPRVRQRLDLKRIEKEKEEDIGESDSSVTSLSLTNYHLPTLTKDLVNSSDKETKRIATLLQTLDGLNGGAIKYIWWQKDGSRRKRLYCIIRVCHDSTFFKFQSLQSPLDMTLFRGFCVELLPSSSDKEDSTVDWGDEETGELDSDGDEFPNANGDDPLWKPQSSPAMLTPADGASGAPLMLKMKLLPYMVRTFICRNLLNTIHQKGPEEFERIALGLLEKWKMSSSAQERWMPFFRGWAMYVLQYRAEQEAPKDSKNSLLRLGPLTNFSYLRHLENFTKLYESGQFRSVSSSADSGSPESQTFVCFVSQSTEVSSALANHFAKTHFSDSPMTVCSLGEAAKNRRSKSCIAYANVSDLTKGIKKFICDKKLAKRSILILLGSNKDEIISLTSSTTDQPPDSQSSWMDIPSVCEGKKLVGQWKSWKKFPCAKRLELGRSFVTLEPKTKDSTIAEIAGIDDTQELVGAIQEVGRSLLDQDTKKQSDPNGGAILAFFPGIPGCGKSTLVESSRCKLGDRMASLKKERGDFYDRNIHVKEGDKIGKNFWDIIEDLLSDDSTDGKFPALVIADKNAPPASWQKLGQISNESNAIMLPVLPNSSVLETTTVEGSILPNGTLLPHASHFYPFSLKFLAVSLSRVLSRPAGEHSGKLDSGFPMACMVVVQFYSFYRYIGADTFQDKMNEKFDKDGALSIKFLEPVQLPFLTAAAQEQNIPDDLKNLLVEALQLRHGHDKNKKFKVKKDDSQMIDLEKRLRSSVEAHKETLGAMTVNLKDAEEAFTAQMMDRIQSLSNKTEKVEERPVIDTIQGDDDVSKNVKLVSIDIDRIQILELLEKHRESGTLKGFFDFIRSFSSSPSPQDTNIEDSDTTMADATEMIVQPKNGDYTSDPNFVQKTHVTMAFAGEKNSPETLISIFSHLQGLEIKISVTGFLWSNTNAALAINIASSAGEEAIPSCENSFAHITVWVAPDVKKSLSNQLPNMVEMGKASRVDFDQENEMTGKLSFWNHKNEPFTI